MIESTLKIARYCPLVIQGFSNFLGLFQGIMANPVILTLTSWLKALSHIMVELGIAIDGGKDGWSVFF